MEYDVIHMEDHVIDETVNTVPEAELSMAPETGLSMAPETGLSMAPETGLSMANRMQHMVEQLQQEICYALEKLDEKATFNRDQWARAEGGGGLTCVLEDGAVFDKAGVNTSAVFGHLPEKMAALLSVETTRFFATGLSLVIHPVSPFVPSVHANFRYFALGEDLHNPVDQWFGGGSDMTPYYPFIEDVQHFHRCWKRVCDAHEVASYRLFKEKCDAYFYLPHRNETRGVGGIFFDYMRTCPEATFDFVKAAGASFLKAYLPIVHLRKDHPYVEKEKRYHQMRRGRYVEFNLLFDRGTRFGIETNGRTESILMSLPPGVSWHYDWRPEPGSAEEKAMWFFQPRPWLSPDA